MTGVTNDASHRRAEPGLIREAFMLPNILSMFRLAMVPFFLWLLLGPKADGVAVAVLMIAGFSDWLDGKLARWLDQTSRLGQVLDPAADRLYIMATLIAFFIRGILPWWVILALVGREVVLTGCILLLKRRGFAYPDVTYVGKGATFVLMYAFPLLLLVRGEFVHGVFGQIVGSAAYALMIWGGVLYIWSGILYGAQTYLALRRGPASAPMADSAHVEA